jgi:hypothetical protein
MSGSTFFAFTVSPESERVHLFRARQPGFVERVQVFSSTPAVFKVAAR